MSFRSTASSQLSACGFSLIEMLLAMTIIGVLAALTIPNFGSINSSARNMVAQRNALAIASVLNAAVSAGANLGFTSDITTSTGAAAIVDVAETGISPSTGSFAGKRFTCGEIDDDEEPPTAALLRYDHSNRIVMLLNPD